MGLGITAYSNLKSAGWHIGSQAWCDEGDHVHAYAYDAFPASFAGIPVVRHDEGSLEGGCYEITEATVEYCFSAGPYSVYNRWRERLAAAFNPFAQDGNGNWSTRPDPDKPFYELIWFADNEGCIGPLAAVELLADFRAHAQDPEFVADDNFRDFARACQLAAVGGLIQFC
jgi:hypothetical protein